MMLKSESLLVVLMICFCVVGCSNNSQDGDSAETASDELVIDDLPMLTDESGHPEHGPHGGELVELGKEAFHIEILHGSDGVKLYVLDSAATGTVAIEADQLTVSLKHDDEVKSFELPAQSLDGEEGGKSSLFSSEDQQLNEWLESGAEGAVTVQIQGKSFTGKIMHDHDHEGHTHDDHAGHDH
ncbi:hypothetical protein [Rhodopirellula sp. SWK7]|uniref:hypothetical protein n=1 Tax=Rhodopirellula sp. SWK7 TaxID=595460 RepID=UPI0002BD9272|nr:hypothetical protein [Rhodopirellula sp. SWK7]EMI41002.1 signal peptide protein [Rhodopirellula sp. SWK7]